MRLGDGVFVIDDRDMADMDLTWPKRRGPDDCGQAAVPINLPQSPLAIGAHHMYVQKGSVFRDAPSRIGTETSVREFYV